MKYVIMIPVILVLAFFCGAVLAFSVTDDEWEQMMEDEEQKEYLRKWYKKQTKKK